MSEDLIRYDILTQEALKGVVHKVMSEVAKAGLPGDHHFYITFNTQAPGVRLSTKMLEEYPEEMTIVIQHQFWDFNVTPNSFEVSLSFGGNAEKLHVPFDAIKSFLDPSVKFGLQFDISNEENATNQAQPDEEMTKQRIEEKTTQSDSDQSDSPKEEKEQSQNTVVNLDAFRNKNG